MDGETLQKLYRAVGRGWAAASGELGLSLSEFTYLAAIDEQAALQRFEGVHGQHLQDIVEALGVNKASASAMVAKLEKAGLVERFQCRMDARAQHIVLTEAGQGAFARGRAVFDRLARDLG